MTSTANQRRGSADAAICSPVRVGTKDCADGPHIADGQRGIDEAYAHNRTGAALCARHAALSIRKKNARPAHAGFVFMRALCAAFRKCGVASWSLQVNTVFNVFPVTVRCREKLPRCYFRRGVALILVIPDVRPVY